MTKQLAAIVGLVSIAVAQPAAAASFSDGPVDHRTGAVAALRFRVPFGPAAEGGRLGLAVNVQHQFVRADHAIRRVDMDGLELAFGRSGPAFYVGGTDVARLDEGRRATSGDERSPWGTIGLVVAGAALIGGACLLYIAHEAEKNSD